MATTGFLRDYWIFSDLDGTLVPAPCRVQGTFVPLSRSPCAGPLRQWLKKGGNVCVITTADLRVFHQVYRQLIDAVGQNVNEGNLLLSPYGGALLYHCTPQGFSEVPDYGPTGRGICLTPEVCNAVVKIATEAFLNFATDALSGKLPLRAGWESNLSLRYRDLWKRLRLFLSREYQAQQVSKKREKNRVRLDPSTKAITIGEWMSQFLKQHSEILRNGGFIRVEPCRSPQVISELLDHAPSEEFEIPCKEQQADRFAQVILVGMPSKYFDHYFGSRVGELRTLGVAAVPQPNSVILCNAGATKGAPVKYLCGLDETPATSLTPNTLKGCVCLHRAIALGDSPRSGDLELTKFREMHFVSFERHSTDFCVQAGIHCHHVGGEEVGCAKFLARLLVLLEAHHKQVAKLDPVRFQAILANVFAILQANKLPGKL